MWGMLVIGAALAALVLLAYRGGSPILIAPAVAVLAVLAAEGGPMLASYTQVFMGAAGRFVVQYFPLFLLGALFGRLMEASGSAEALARGIVGRLGPDRAIPAVVLCCAAMTYGGVSLFVVAFAVWPIAAALFRDARLPRELIPAAIALGAFTFTMTALPGTPAIQNAIPMPYFGTTAFAAPGLGLISGAVMLGFGWWWLEVRARRIGPVATAPAVVADPSDRREGPSLAVAATPLVLVLGLNFLFTTQVLQRLDTAYLARPEYGATGLGAVLGLWSVIAALTAAGLTLIALNLGRLRRTLGGTLDEGAKASLEPVFNTASLVGFGAVIASLGAFGAIRDWVSTVGGANPLISLAVGTGLLAGLTGSASGGMSIALEALGRTYLEAGTAAGIAPDLLHRVTAVATGTLDALPHNGAVVTLLTICGLTHRQAYGDVAMVAIVGPLLALVLLVALGSTLGSF
jgi:H+/gluconate symporter-like permease